MPGIKFFNIRTGESRICDTEPMISAHYNSGNLHVNAMRGQDFGWRLAPEVIERIIETKKDKNLLAQIAAQLTKPLDTVNDLDILYWIFLKDAREAAEKEEFTEADHTQQYEEEIASIKKRHGLSGATSAAPNTAKTPSRAELNEQAEALGLNPDDYKNVAEISAAINDKMK